MLWHHRVLLLLFVTALVVPGCGGSDDPAAPAGNSDTGDYLKELPTWSEFSPPLQTAEIATDTSTACLDVVDDVRYLCVETPKSLTDTPQDVVTFNAGGDILWPGALIQGATYLGGVGTMRELGIRQRAPLTISIDLLTMNNSRTVVDPTLATVRSAVGELIQAATDAGHQPGSAISYRKTTAHSLEQMSLQLGLSVKYMGASVRSSLDYSSANENTTVAAYFTQRMFTVNVVQPQTPEQFFSNEFTRERLQEQIDLGRIGPNNLPVYVSQIVYGRMLVMTMTSNYSASQMIASLNASYAAVEAGVTYTGDSVWENSTFTVAAVGGDDTGVLGLLTSGELASYFAEETELTEAAPISYTLLNLADNSQALVSETTSYVERVCSDVNVNLINVESQWREAVQGVAGDVIYTFVPTAYNIGLSQEVPAPTANNRGVGNTLTFLGADTGYPFDFVISKAMTPGTFTWNDHEKDGSFGGCPYPFLSPGDVTNYEDDDFEVSVTRVDEGLVISGIAVAVGHNNLVAGEYLEVTDPNNILLDIFDSSDPLPGNEDGGYQFMGVASPLPLKKIYFNEDDGGDDICFQNVWISVRNAGGN